VAKLGLNYPDKIGGTGQDLGGAPGPNVELPLPMTSYGAWGA